MQKSTAMAALLSLLVAASLTFIYCGDDKPPEPPDPLAGAVLCLSDSSCTMGAACDTSEAIDVSNCGNSTALSWTATEDAAWLSLSVASGETPAQLCLMADSNRTGAERTATVTVSADDLKDESIDIAVTQPTVGPTLSVSLAEWEAYCLGEESPAISVTNSGSDVSVDWVVSEDEDWLELSATNGSTPGSFTVTADTNNTGENRTGTVTVTAEGAAGSPWEVAVEQQCVIALAGNYCESGDTYELVVSGDYAYVADGGYGLQIIDVSDPTNPTLAGSSDAPDYAEGVYVSGDYAYVADYYYGLRIIDVSNPTNPVEVGGFDTPGSGCGVFVSGDYAYVADLLAGLQIIDVSDPANPTSVGTYDTPDHARGVVVSGNYAYVTDRATGLLVIDISNPASLTLAGSYDTPDYALRVFISGSYAYVANSQTGLFILDISDPTSPALTGSWDTPSSVWDVRVSGDYAFVAGVDGGLQIIDVSDPTQPALITSDGTLYSTWGVDVSGGYVYVADDECLLSVFKLGLQMD